MKKIYICAVFGLLFASCSTDVEKSEIAQQSVEVQHGTQANWGGMITEIENSFVGVNDFISAKYLISQVETKAYTNTDFLAVVTSSYLTPTELELKNVMTSDMTQLINGMNYSATMKMYMKDLLVNNQSWAVSPEANPSLKVSDVRVLNFLKEINDPDDEWNTRKPLAFAYGYQKDEARAVVFAVLSSQYKKIK